MGVSVRHWSWYWLTGLALTRPGAVAACVLTAKKE